MSDDKADEFFILWTTSEDAGEIYGSLLEIPDYLRQQARSRQGRPARGRLWIDDAFPDDIQVDPWPDNELSRKCDKLGGIVFKAEDLEVVLDLPGIVTDLRLNEIDKRKRTFGLVLPFWIDTDAYTARDQEMFVAGFEFCQIVDRMRNNSDAHSTTIHRENESRVRMAAGRLGREVSIEQCEAELDPDGTWSYLEIKAES